MKRALQLRGQLLLFTVSLFIAGFVFAQEDGASWLKLIDGAERISHATGIMEQTITTSGGSERTLTMRFWSAEEGDLSLMAYTAPPRVKGDKILLRDGGDNIWYYMKRRDVTRHFVGTARRQSAMGSDFSYEDLSSSDMAEDYTAEVLGHETLDGIPCVKLKCTPTESGPSYQYIIVWAGIDDCLPRKIDYYDDDGLLKTLTFSDFQTIEGHKLAMRMEMVNIREGSRTLMVQKSISFKEEPAPSLFTKEALSREIQ